MHGYQLRSEFEAATGATWPLNIGQVYTTLSRLERDGLVEPSARPSEAGVAYRITDAGPCGGRQLVRRARRARGPAARRAGDQARAGADHAGRRRPAVVQIQRTATLRSLQELHAAEGGRRPGRRRRLAAGAGGDDLPGGGRGPLARPLRDAHLALPGSRRPTPSKPKEVPSMSVLELRDVSRVHGTGETAVHALRGVSLTVDARRAGRGDGPVAARASRRC